MRDRFSGRNIGNGQIALFGLTGGLLPCPAAVTVLLLCLQLKQFSLGMGLVLAFSVGLALTLLASGLIAALGLRHAASRWPGFDGALARLPYLGCAVIAAIGLYVGYSGLVRLA
jgi:nickel/cobalt exporter